MSVVQSQDRAWYHLLDGSTPAVLLVPGSMLFDLDDDAFAAIARGDPAMLAELMSLVPSVPADPGTLPPVTALSLNVAQACNMACTYCYADEGRFGGSARLMERDVAFRGIDALLEANEGRRVTIGFIGGEPFVNRALLHECVAYAQAAGRQIGTAVTFAVTTNATLLQDEDIRLLRANRFAVTVSLDGGPKQNRHRPLKDGRDSTAAALSAIAPLLADPGEARIAARATITRDDLDVDRRIEWLIAQGFQEAGVAPARTGPRPELLLREGDWPRLLDAMVLAAGRELDRVDRGGSPRFSNLWVGLRAIHRGSARPLPCGSAASYLSLDADGRYFSCHRTVGKQEFDMGSLARGWDDDMRRSFLEQRHVDKQEPCASCWARYLCGGGCHAEVAAMGRSGCDFIRGWLDFCLRTYRTVSATHPELLTRGET